MNRPSAGRTRLGRACCIAAVAFALLLLPDASRAPTTVSLVKVDTAKAVDFGDGVLWILALGSDARGDDMMEGNADAIELIGLNFDTGAAVALGIPRDFWVPIPDIGHGRINLGLRRGGPEVMAGLVADLTQITPDYVAVTGFDGFTDMVDAIGGVSVHSPARVVDRRHGVTVHRGLNALTGAEATGFARTRELPGNDFDRAANHQALLRAILREVVRSSDTEGFVERGATAALKGLSTDLSPLELYRFAQALDQIRTDRVTTCVLSGTPGTEFGADILYPDTARALRLARDARDDAVLDRGCGS